LKVGKDASGIAANQNSENTRIEKEIYKRPQHPPHSDIDVSDAYAEKF
jgi:hypothetical protein